MDWPETLKPYRRTREFTQDTVPDGLRQEHNTRAGVWAKIHVLEGCLRYEVGARSWRLTPEGPPGLIEPEVRHRVAPEGAVRFFVEFYREG